MGRVFPLHQKQNLMKNHFFAFLLIALIFIGCNNEQPLQSDTESNESNVVVQKTLGIPMPTAEMLSALGPDNDVSILHLLPEPLFVVVGKPKQFLTSPVGTGNE